MAKLQIVYDACDDSEEIIQMIQDLENLKTDEDSTMRMLQAKFQLAFDEGRRFQKHITQDSEVKDSILCKLDIQ